MNRCDTCGKNLDQMEVQSVQTDNGDFCVTCAGREIDRLHKLEADQRWRRWPEEMPESSGWYLCSHGRLKGGPDMSTVFYEAENYDWVFEINPKHWRPIGELPKEKTEA